MSMHLFPDTNVWLSFYHLSKDDLEELHKVAVLIDQKLLVLYLPDQVKDEFWRNRDTKVAEAIKHLSSETISGAFPQMCKQYEEYTELRNIIGKYKTTKGRLIEKLIADYEGEKLYADDVIQYLFSMAKRVMVTDDILLHAKLRFDLGNPPGKDRSYGDAVNWECLIAEVPQNEDLYVITEDKDYFAKTKEGLFSPYLQREWREKKAGKVRLYKTLFDFFQDHYPNIKLATELEKNLLIIDFVESYNFARTRSTLRKLVQTTDFSKSQLNEIVDGVIANDQIYSIAQDTDINSYLLQLIQGRDADIPALKLAQFHETVSSQSAAQVEREAS